MVKNISANSMKGRGSTYQKDKTKGLLLLELKCHQYK